jgi:uncharacterized protein (DUF2062 family)
LKSFKDLSPAGLRSRLAEAWRVLLGSPGGPERVARGAAAGAFAAMVPAFGAHVVLAILVAFLLRGTRIAAVAACLLVGNPLTHAVLLPLSYEIGRVILPRPPAPHVSRLPSWAADALPVAEEALVGGAALGLAAAPIAFLLVRAALRRRARQLFR